MLVSFWQKKTKKKLGTFRTDAVARSSVQDLRPSIHTLTPLPTFAKPHIHCSQFSAYISPVYLHNTPHPTPLDQQSCLPSLLSLGL